MAIKNNYVVEKSNVLSEIRNVNMSLQELRFFSIYLAKINARDISTRRVRFPLSDFQKIMGIGRMNIAHFKKTVDGLLCKVVHIPNDRGGLSSFQLFKEVELYKDTYENWIVEVDAHDKALPLMFNLKSNYFKYELWNALHLKSVNQLLVYEKLKQYEKIGIFEINVSELREYLCIASNMYERLRDFRVYVLDSCQKALKENTDICFTYERGKIGAKGKWLTIIFYIQKNTEYKNVLNLEEFIKIQPESETEIVVESLPEQINKSQKLKSEKNQLNISGNLEKDILPSDIEKLCNMLALKVPEVSERTPELLKKRLELIYSKVIISTKSPIKNPVAYLATCIHSLTADDLPPLSSPKSKSKKSDFCKERYELMAKIDFLDLLGNDGSEECNKLRAQTLAEIDLLKAIIKEKTGEDL